MRIFLRFALAIALGLTSTLTTTAQTWNGTTDTLWGTATNWSTGVVPTAAQTATFNNAGNANTSINLGGVTQNISTILFDTAAAAPYTFNGNAGDAFLFSAAGGITANATVATNQIFNTPLQLLGAFTVTNNSTGSLTLNGGLSMGSGGAAGQMTVTGTGATTVNGVIAASTITGLTKSGAGILTLGNANLFTGTTTVNAGTLRFGSNNALLSTSTLAVPASATVDFQGNTQTLGNLTFNNPANATINFTGTAGSGLTVSNAALSLSPLNGAFNLSLSLATLGSFTYNNTGGTFTVSTGATSATAGAVSVTLSSTLNTISAGTFNIGNGTTSNTVPTTTVLLGTTNVINANTIRLGNARPTGNLRFATGLTNPILTIAGATGGASTAILNIGVAHDSNTLATVPSDTVDTTLGTLNGNFSTIQIAQNLPSAGSGRIIAMNGNFLTAVGTVNATTITLGLLSNRTVPTPAGTMQSQVTAVYTLSNGGVHNIGTINVATSAYTDTFTTNLASFLTATINLNTGATLNATTIQPGTIATSTLAAGATFTVNRNFNWNDGTIGNIVGTDLTVSVPTIVANGAAANHTFRPSGSNVVTVGSVISGVGAITKNGSGVLVFTGANTYSGGTMLIEGTLQTNLGSTLGAITGPLTLNPGTAVALNGTNQTVGVLSGTGGNIVNNSPSASLLTAGTAVSSIFSGNLLEGSPSGVLAFTKAGAGTLTLAGTNTYSGLTTINAGTLRFTGAPSTLSGLALNAGANLIYANGTGNNLSALPSLSLVAGTGNSQLTLQLATPTTSDRLGTAGAAVTGTATNTLVLNFTALAGFGVGTYPILNAGSGLFPAVNPLNYSLGTLPPGFAYNLIKTDTLVSLDVFTVVPSSGPIYWIGGTNAKWNETNAGNAVNFTTDVGGTVGMTGSPNSSNTVNFSAAANVITANTITNTLETSFTINDLIFNANTNAGAITGITIAAGVVPTSTLTIAPTVATAGINVQTGAPTAIAITAPLAVGAVNQTWTVADALTSFTTSGGLAGSATITTAGLGSVFLNNLAAGFTGSIVIGGAAVSIGGAGATTIAGVVSGTGVLIKADAGTVTLGSINTYTGGTQINGGTLAVLSVENGTVNSGIGASTSAAGNLIFNGGALTTAALVNTTDRNITVSAGGGRIAAITANAAMVFNGSFTGAGVISFGLNTTAVSSTSTYTLIGDSSAGFTGGVTINNGNVTITSANSLGAGAKTITVQVNTTGNASLRLDGTNGDITLPAAFSFVTSLGNNPASGIFNIAGNNTIAGSITLTSGYGGTLFSTAAGSLTLSGNVSIQTGQTSRAIIVGGAGAGTVTGALTDNGTGLLGITKDTGAGTWTVTGALNTYTGNTVVLGGTLRPGSDNAFSLASRLFFGDQSAAVGTFDTNGFNVQFNGLSAQSNNVAGATLNISAGKTVTIAGGILANVVNIGSIATANVSTTRLNVTGATGTLTVNDPTRNIVVAQLITAAGANSPSIFDLSALGTFNATVSNVYVGRPTAVAGTAATTSSAENAQFLLAAANTITASGNFVVGAMSFSSGVTTNAALRLGTTNAINAGAWIVGNGRANGTVNFQTGLTNPTVTLRGVTGGSSRTNITLGDQANVTAVGGGGGGSTQILGLLDFSTGTTDALVDTFVIGSGATVASNARGLGNGTVTVSGVASVLDINTLILARNISDTTATTLANAPASIGLLTLNAGTTTVNTAATLGIDQDITGGGIQDLAATITVNGGSFTVGSVGTPVNLTMGDHTSTNPGAIAAILNVNGGTVTINGNILRGALGGGVTNSTVTLAGGILNLTGHTIGSATNPITTTNFQTGTLSNVLEINGGTTGLAKSTPGTLTLAGVNSYTGPTTVTNGTLLVTANNAAATGAVLVDGGATVGGTLRGTGTVGGAVTINGGVVPGTIRGGASIGTLTLASTLSVNSGANVFVEIADGSTLGMLSTGTSTTGTLPNNPVTNSYINITGATTTIDVGTLFTIDGTGVSFTQTAYSYKIAKAVNDQSAVNITAPGQFTFVGFGFTPANPSVTGDLAGNVYLNFTNPVPEPALLLGLSLLGFAAVRRRS